MTEQLCGMCRVQKITFKGTEFCAVCDNPPGEEEALWFVYWCYSEPEEGQ